MARQLHSLKGKNMEEDIFDLKNKIDNIINKYFNEPKDESIELDFEKGIIYYNGEKICLTFNELIIFTCLIKNNRICHL